MEKNKQYNENERTYTIPKVPEGVDSTTHHINHIKEAIKLVHKKVEQGENGQILLDGANKDHPFVVEQAHTVQQIAEKYNRRHPGTIDLSKVTKNIESVSAKNPTGEGRQATVTSPTPYVYR